MRRIAETFQVFQRMTAVESVATLGVVRHVLDDDLAL